MEIKEIIEVIKKLPSCYNNVFRVVDMESGGEHIPMILENNEIKMFAATSFADTKLRGRTLAGIRLGELLKHLEGNCSIDKSLYFVSNTDTDYIITGYCDLEDPKGGHFELSKW